MAVTSCYQTGVGAPGCTGQRGVALVIVVWFIAGMSLLVAGIVAQARTDTRMAQLHLARAKTVAAGDGAIQLMLVDLMSDVDSRADVNEIPPGKYRLGELEVMVVLVPTSKLVDPNSASSEVLIELFVSAGQLGQDSAQTLAGSVLKSRTPAPGPRRRQVEPTRLDAIEDLLRIEGMSRTLLDAIRDSVVVGKAAQGGAGGAFRADAIVRYGDKTWLRRRWVMLENRTGSALPWRMVRTEPPRVLLDQSLLPGGSLDV